MILIVAEKAIAGKRIAELLSEGTPKAKYIGSAQAYDFKKAGKEYTMVPLRGHITDIDFPKKFSYWLGTDLKKLIDSEIDYNEKEKAIISALKKTAKEADEIIIATDADREGEAIGLEALTYAKEKNPKIKSSRAYFSAITQQDIDEAFSKLEKPDLNLADSANARREIDLVWGAVLTRFLSLMSGRLGNQYLSAGRVQSPVLAIIVKREKERLAFKKKKYWELKALFEKDNKQFEANHSKGRFWKKEEAQKAYDSKKETGTVTEVKSTKRTLKKPLPFNTTSFLRAANAIGFSATEAMNSAESLYQQGFISYPRTDNATYPKTLNLKGVLEEMQKVDRLASLATQLLGKSKLVPSRGKEAKDHPPIYPVTAADPGKVGERQWKIYELVVRRFFATLADDAETRNLAVEIDLNKEMYTANGQLITKKGWKEFYPYSALHEVILPDLEKGDIVKLIELNMEEKETQPPNRYSQGSLIKLMEELGLGTKSTRHSFVQKLYYRHYISGIKVIEPNKIAFSVIDVLDKYSQRVIDPKMTSELEQEMHKISEGKKTKLQVVDASRKRLQDILGELLEHKDKIGSELREALREDAIVGKCPGCKDGKLRMLVSRNNKRFLGCTTYPKCHTTFPLPQKGRIVHTEDECETCHTPVIKVFGKRYRYEMCINPECETKKDWGKKKEEWAKKKQERAKKKAEAIANKKSKKKVAAKVSSKKESKK